MNIIWAGYKSNCSVLIKTIIITDVVQYILTNDNIYLFIIMCLGKYFPTPEVGVVPETIKDHVMVSQGQSSMSLLHVQNRS